MGGDVAPVDDANPREAMRQRMAIVQNKVAEEYTEGRRKEGKEVIGGGYGIDTPRQPPPGLKMLQAAPIGMKSHLNQSGIQDARTKTGLSLLSRQETRPKNDPKTYVPLRGDAFKERMARHTCAASPKPSASRDPKHETLTLVPRICRQHAKMIATFGYVPPEELTQIQHKKDFSKYRRKSLMTRQTKRRLKRVETNMEMLQRAGNGWEVCTHPTPSHTQTP